MWYQLLLIAIAPPRLNRATDPLGDANPSKILEGFARVVLHQPCELPQMRSNSTEAEVEGIIKVGAMTTPCSGTWLPVFPGGVVPETVDSSEG